MATLVVANNTRTWGVFTTTGSPATTLVDGPYFQLSAAGILSVNCINNGGAPISVASGSFNGSVSEYVVDANVHQYEIVYYVAAAYFYIDNVLIHTILPTTAPLFNNLTLPVTAQTINSAGGTANGALEMWAGTILRLGREISAPKTSYIHGAVAAQVLKIGSGSLRLVCLNGLGNGSTISLYDAVTATNPIAIISPPNGATGQTYTYDIDFYTGLCITTVNAATDITVSYE